MAVDERIKNIKIAVHSEEESRQVQEKLFELGASWRADNQISPKYISFNYLGVVDGRIFVFPGGKKDFDNHSNKEIYVEDLFEMEKKEEKSLLYKSYFINVKGNKMEIRRRFSCMCKVTQDTQQVYFKEDILETKEKILEDYRNNRRKHSMSDSELEEILNKRIGEIK